MELGLQFLHVAANAGTVDSKAIARAGKAA
jgi:hypothetical protein